MTPVPAGRLLSRVLDVLEGAQQPYAVMGGFAIRHWALPRPTFDVDIAVAAAEAPLQQLLDRFEDSGFEVPDVHRRGFADTVGGLRKLTVRRFEDGHVWDVDIFLATTALVRRAFERRVPVVLDGRAAWVVTAEDLLLFKLVANRRKDWLDVEELLLVVGPLDTAYLAAAACEQGILDRLSRALSEAGRPLPPASA